MMVMIGAQSADVIIIMVATIRIGATRVSKGH